MRNSLYISNNFRTFTGWIGRSCKPSDKGLLTALPHLYICQHNLMKNKLKLSAMLRFEELPEVNSERWLSLEDLPDEVWKVYPLNNLYHISNYSRVKSFANGFGNKQHILKSSKNYGYWSVMLYSKETKKAHTKGIHRMMAETFIPNPLNLPQVNHKDENKEHNLIQNLEWCTNSYNVNYGTRNARAGMAISDAMSIKIAQYSKEGKYIRTFKGMNEASRTLGLLIQCPRHGYKNQFWSSSGFLWRQYEENVDMTQDIPPFVDISGCRFGVEQYSEDGNYIATFATLKYACKYMGMNRVTLKGACLGHIHIASGYRWKYVPMQYIKENLVFDINGRCVDAQKINTTFNNEIINAYDYNRVTNT